MKQPIDPEDIRKGDLIRNERREDYDGKFLAVEYRAEKDGESSHPAAGGDYFLLERPEPPFEPYWGMVIGDPDNEVHRACYIPSGEGSKVNWLSSYPGPWMDDDWARARIAEGWIIVSKQEEK